APGARSHDGQPRPRRCPRFSGLPRRGGSMNASITGKRYLITGGAGVVGSTIADHLVEGGAAEVIIVDQFSRGRPANLAWAQANGNLTVIHNDLRDTALLTEAMAGVDVVFHQAA